MIDITKPINWPKLTINVTISYAISWMYFILILSFFQKIFGGLYGVFIAHITSWILWFLIVYFLHKMNPNGDK